MYFGYTTVYQPYHLIQKNIYLHTMQQLEPTSYDESSCEGLHTGQLAWSAIIDGVGSH